MWRSLVEEIREGVGGPSREEVQQAFDRIGAQIDDIADETAHGSKVVQALFSPRDVALVMLECSLQLEVIRELDTENNKATSLMTEAAELIIAKKETENSLMQTIFQTWCYLGHYKNDAEDATHAKRLLQNCLLVRGSDKVKDAVKQKMLAPQPVKWWISAWSYAWFAVAAYFFALSLGGLGVGFALFWLTMMGCWAVGVAQNAAKGGAHVQAV